MFIQRDYNLVKIGLIDKSYKKDKYEGRAGNSRSSASPEMAKKFL